MDCARVAKRLDANVSVVYRRTRVEMPAITAEMRTILLNDGEISKVIEGL